MNDRFSKPSSRARELLVQAFLRLYARKPWQKISVLEIVNEAGYARGTFYRHFSGVDDLLMQVEKENTCTLACRYIIENVREIPLEEATDIMASFYQQRFETVSVLVAGSNGNNYLDAQRIPMKHMFAALLNRGFIMSSLQLDIAAEYIASAKTGMIRLWLEKGNTVSLSQINKMSEELIESDLWTFVARQAPSFGGSMPKRVIEDEPFNYPWLKSPENDD